jgi:hypothetical protein
MNITKSRLVQIIKEEIENLEKDRLGEDLKMNISKYDRDHPGKSCAEAHGGLSHDEYASGNKAMLTLEEEDNMLNEAY